jgi:hypothetical protein
VAACSNLFGSKLCLFFSVLTLLLAFVTSELKRFAVGDSQFPRESHETNHPSLTAVVRLP